MKEKRLRLIFDAKFNLARVARQVVFPVSDVHKTIDDVKRAVARFVLAHGGTVEFGTNPAGIVMMIDGFVVMGDLPVATLRDDDEIQCVLTVVVK